MTYTTGSVWGIGQVSIWVLATFTTTISLGVVILGAIISIVGVAFIFYGVKYKTAYEAESAVSSSYKAMNEAYEKRIEKLDKAIEDAAIAQRECLHTIGEQKKIIERLSALENIETIIKLMGEEAQRSDRNAEARLQQGLTQVREVWDSYEAAAAERHHDQMKALREVGTVLSRVDDKVDGDEARQ